MATNTGLTKANKAKKDEFYTQLADIEAELKHYKKHFKEKTVFCNCDDPYESNFFKYFAIIGKISIQNRNILQDKLPISVIYIPDNRNLFVAYCSLSRQKRYG